MSIIKLDATDSTNSYLRRLISDLKVQDFTAVMAKSQKNGRGQMGTVWSSEASQNLTFSVFKDLTPLNIQYPFYVSIVTSLALLRTLSFFSIPKLSVKWPNDILSEDKKICGVLIENVIKQNQMKATILGIGLNLNQTLFENLPKASSLKIITGKTYEIDEVAHLIISNLKDYFSILQTGNIDVLKAEYLNYLFRKDKPSTFKNEEGQLFTGIIKSVSNMGNLKVLLEDDIIKEYDLKEIQLLY